MFIFLLAALISVALSTNEIPLWINLNDGNPNICMDFPSDARINDAKTMILCHSRGINEYDAEQLIEAYNLIFCGETLEGKLQLADIGVSSEAVLEMRYDPNYFPLKEFKNSVKWIQFIQSQSDRMFPGSDEVIEMLKSYEGEKVMSSWNLGWGTLYLTKDNDELFKCKAWDIGDDETRRQKMMEFIGGFEEVQEPKSVHYNGTYMFTNKTTHHLCSNGSFRIL